jgi:uncharacterized protein (TIGR02099 family)
MKFLKNIGLALFVTFVLLLALAMGGMRLVISNIDLFESEINHLLKSEISKGLVFDQVSGAMVRFNPVLRIDNVSLNLPDRSQPLSIDHLEVEFDFWRSLRERAPVVYEISGELKKLELTRDRTGKWWIDEYRIDRDDAGEIDLPGFSQLLELLPRYLKLDLQQLIVHDQAHGSSHRLSQVAARIVHREGRFFTQVSMLLPEEFGRGLLVKSVVDPNSSVIYLHASSLQLAPVARLFDIDTRGLKSGAFGGQLWLDMSGYRITGMQGDLLLNHGVVQVADDKPTLTIDYHARFNAVTSARRWRVSSKFERLFIDGESVPGFDAQIDIPAVAADDRLAASINRLPLSSLPVIAGQWLPAGVRSQILQGSLQGLLQDVIFEIDLEQAENFRLGARISDLSNEAFGRFPGIDKLDTDLVMGHNRLAATLHGNAVKLDFGDQFRAPLQADSLRMELLLNRLPSGNLLVAVDDIKLRNQDLGAVGRLLLETDGEQAPFMYLRAAFDDVIAASTSKYIPIRLLPTDVIEWLDRGIIEGYVSAGELQFHGRLGDIRELAREQAAELFVDFRVEQASIFFAPGWLPAKNGYGRILFHNVGVEFDLERVSYEYVDNIKASGKIADFDRASLDLAITAAASTRDALRVWRNTPVGQRFDDVLTNLQDIGGAVNSQIDLHLPIVGDLDQRKVNVRVGLDNVAARVPHWGLDLAQINGQVRVTEDSISARDISARFYGDPISVDIDSSNSAVSTDVAVRGRIASANLLRKLPGYLSEPVSGDSDWRLRLNIAGDAAPAEQPFLRVNLTSSLRDTQVDMPLPFRKSAADEVGFSADVDFLPGEIRFHGKLGSKLRGRGMLREVGSAGLRLDRLEIAFDSSFRRQQLPGIYLHGRIAELSVNDWLDFLRRSGEDDPALLKYVVLGVDRGQAFGREFNSAVIEVQQVDGRFLGQIDSSLAKGSFEAPIKTSLRDPLVVKLDYLKIDKSLEASDFSTLRPSRLPAVRLSSNSFRYDNMNFSDLLFVAYPRGETLQVQTLDLRRDRVQLNSHGKWKYDELYDRHKSSLEVTLAGPDLGEAIAGLGFGNSVSSGEIDLKGEFSWPAPFFAFGLDNVSGKAKMKVTDGVLNNVEPGSGRYVGLLSLSALPRRLALDFSDVVIDGMEFDEINGSYRVKDGVLYTEDTELDGPAAKIKISGKTGIIDRDYDQVMRVTPKFRQTLPLLGAVAVSTTVGWGLLLLHNLFGTVIDNAVEIEYRVTGSWDDPQIELLKAVDENQQALPKIDK